MANIQNGNGESKVRKLLYNEISFFIAIIGVAVGIVLFITGPDAQTKTDIEVMKTQIETIKTNDLEHIQSSLYRIEADQDKNEIKISDMNENIIKIMTSLGI